jgi:sugar phosphate permease
VVTIFQLSTLIDMKQKINLSPIKRTIMKTISKIIGIIATLIIVWNADSMFEIFRTRLILGLVLLLVGYFIYGDEFLKPESI